MSQKSPRFAGGRKLPPVVSTSSAAGIIRCVWRMPAPRVSWITTAARKTPPRTRKRRLVGSPFGAALVAAGYDRSFVAGALDRELDVPAPPADPAEAFKAARQLLLDGDYANAGSAFETFVTNYPDNPRTPEARYWLGETLFVREAYGDAAGAYIGAIRGWPQTAWAPDATLKLSRALVALKKPADACKTLDELGRRYPKAPPAVLSRAAATRVAAKCA